MRRKSHNHTKFSHVTRKPVFGVFDQVRLKQICLAKETCYSLEILAVASIGIILSKQRTTKGLIRLRGCGSHMPKTGFLMTWLNYSPPIAPTGRENR